MPTLTTVVLVSTNAKKTKGVLVDSINDFKSEVSRGVLFSTTNISAAWVNMVMENQPKAVELFNQYISRHPYLKDYYEVSADQQSIKVTERGENALTFNSHLGYFRSMGILSFQNIFTSKPDSKPIDYSHSAAWMITSLI
ncbi:MULTISPECIES: hypothetical protein [Acinetobacter]|uniref:Uncharacterized protein n=1 Tax=Acinetobacter indicus TaxID=756892 RepID=A0A6C0Y6V8_9GAMM|nr:MULTISPECIES: hypothetical protein [Acinetobacter]QIC71908.1 hypothetical protein FSC09_16080 [Acinetobacter indicus]QKQ71445.1 hypothetical protein E5Y90_14535 [Acinetobacter sp. 10FS3-1]